MPAATAGSSSRRTMTLAKDRSALSASCLLGAMTPTWRARLRRRLRRWYQLHARNLPWRGSRDPYAIWVSEIMLQQTQVETVKPYFERFLRTFPHVRALAAAPEEQVLRAWEGLGYYRRARQLHAAAQQIVDTFAGEFPDDVETLRTLPGIGRYTAGAVASIAFDRRAPILEANTTRLLSRLLGYEADPAQRDGQRLLWEVAEAILPRDNVGDFNQGLMELGALVCTPSDPVCDDCPLEPLCAARAAGRVAHIPAQKTKTRYTDVCEAAVVVRKNDSLLLRRCPEGQRWAGLWDFPRFETEMRGPLFLRAELSQRVYEETGIESEPANWITTIKHGVTRYRITLDCYEARFIRGRLRSTPSRPLKWVPLGKVDDYPLSTTGRRLASLLVD